MADVPPLEISVQETQRLLAQESADFRLVDVRDPDEYAYCRRPRAELIPLATVPGDAPAKLPDKSAHIVVYCHHGMRSLRATEALRQMGYTRVQSIAGGIDKWSHEIDPATPTY